MMSAPATDLADSLHADYVFDKGPHYSCVDDAFLCLLSDANGGTLPKQVYVCGLDTDCCVLATAVGLFEKGIRPIVLVDLCDSTGGTESHKAGLLALKRLIGKKNVIDHPEDMKPLSIVSPFHDPIFNQNGDYSFPTESKFAGVNDAHTVLPAPMPSKTERTKKAEEAKQAKRIRNISEHRKSNGML